MFGFVRVDVTRLTWFQLNRMNWWLTQMWKNPGSGQMRGMMHDIIRVSERLPSNPRKI
ncbi:hypothetical protein AHAS_Ahas02G0147600 [Arachis hypogaea]